MSSTLSPEQRDELVAELRRRTNTPGFHFLSSEHLQELNKIESSGAPILSLFMKLTPEMRSGDTWQIAFKKLARQALDQTNGSADHRRAIQRELDRVEETLARGLPRTGRGLAIFACEELGLMRQLGVAISLPNRAVVDRRPHMRPLARVRDEHDRFGIVLISFLKTRFFFSQIGLVEEVFDFEGREVETYDFASKDQRQDQRDERKREQAKRAAHAMDLMVRELGIRHVIYSCPPDMEAPFLDALDQATRERVAGSFHCDINATSPEVAERAEEAQREVEAREEFETIQRVHEMLPAKAVAGINETVDMLNHQRVMTLLIDDGAEISGGMDSETHMLTLRTNGTHEATGNPISGETDLVELMLERALEQGASLELVRSPAAKAEMAKLGPAAALLRY